MSLYNDFKEKEIKRRKRKNILYKFRILISCVVVLIIATFFSLSFFKGKIVDNIIINNHFSYGEKITYEKARSFLGGKIEYQFKSEEGVWTNEEPVSPGTYYIRAKTNNLFGMESYSKPIQFAIGEKNLILEFSEEKLEYGSFPKINNIDGLIAGDTIENIDFSYKDLRNEKTEINIEDIVIKNDKGDDVTGFYNIVYDDKEFEIVPRTIDIKLDNTDFVYSGKEVDINVLFDKLAFDDKTNLNIKYYDLNNQEVDKLIDAGKYTFELDSSNMIINSKGEDVTRFYTFNIEKKDLNIQKRDVVLKSESISKEYDGKPILNYENIVEENLCENHKVVSVFDYFDQLTSDVFSQENVFHSIIFDSNDIDVSHNYNITYIFGNLEIVRRKIVLGFKTEDYIYDGKRLDYNFSDYNDYLVEGNFIENEYAIPIDIKILKDNIETDKILNAGKYKVYFNSLECYGSFNQDNYDISFYVNKFEILKRKVVLMIDDINDIVYGDNLDINELSKYHYLSNALGTEKILSEDEKYFEFLIDIFNKNNSNSKFDAGNYIAKIVKASFSNNLNENYEFDISNVTEFSILKKELLIQDKIKEFVYDGKEHYFSSTTDNFSLKDITLDSTFLENKFHFQFEKDGRYYTKIKDAGIYNIEFKLNEELSKNYSLIFENKTFEVLQKEIYLSLIEDKGKEYDGSEYHYLNEFGNYLNNENNQFCEEDDVKLIVKYFLKNSDGSYIETSSVKNAGEYIIKISDLVSNGNTNLNNYKIVFGKDVSFNITKRTIVISPKVSDSIYDGESKIIHDINVENIVANDIFEVTNFIIYSNDQIVSEAKNTGKYEVEIDISSLKSDSIDNYIVQIKKCEFNIFPRNVVLKIIKISNFEYDGNIFSYSNNFGNFVITDDDNKLVGNQNVKIVVSYFDIDGNSVIPKNAGTYFVKIVSYELDDNTDDNNYVFDISDEVSFEILKRKVTIQPTLEKIIYDGEYHDFISQENNFEVIFGSFVFDENIIIQSFVFYDSNNFLKSIKNAGTYDVNIRKDDVLCVGNTLIQNYELTFESGLVDILPRKINISLLDFENKTYDGIAYSYSNEYNNFIYNDSNLLTHVVSGENLKVNCSFLREYLNFVESVSQAINYGVYTLVYEDFSSDENTLISNYLINVTNNISFSIYKRKIDIELVSDDFVYDGKNHTFLNYVVSKGTIVKGDNVYFSNVKYYINDVYYNNYLNDSGVFRAVIDEKSFSPDSENYEITCLEKTINISKRDIILDLLEVESGEFNGNYYTYNNNYGNYNLNGSSLYDIVEGQTFKILVLYYQKIDQQWINIEAPCDAGTYKVIYQSIIAGENTNLSNYKIDIAKKESEFSIRKKVLEINPIVEDILIYDGTNQSDKTFKYVYNTNINEIEINFNLGFEEKEVYDAGTYSLIVKNYYSYYDKLDDNFEIIVSSFSINVIPKTIDVKFNTISSVYNGKTVNYEQNLNLKDYKKIYDQVCEKDRDELDIYAHIISDSIIDASEYKNVVRYYLIYKKENGRKSTNYIIDENAYGNYIVLKRKITITSSDKSFVFDGLNKGTDEFSYEKMNDNNQSGLCNDHTILIKEYSKFIKCGVYDNIQSYSIINKNLDVTDNYEIINVYGKIEITQLTLNIKFKDIDTSMVFNGSNPLISISDYYEIVEKVNGFTITVEFNIFNSDEEKITDNVLHVGKYKCYFSRIVLFKNDSYYVCEYKDGVFYNENVIFIPQNLQVEYNIEITPLILNFTTSPKTFSYDGKEHNYLDYYLIVSKENNFSSSEENTILSRLNLKIDYSKPIASVKEIGEAKENIFSLYSLLVNEGDINYINSYGNISIDNRYNLNDKIYKNYNGKNIIQNGIFVAYDNEVIFFSVSSLAAKNFNGMFVFQLVDEEGNYLTDTIKDAGEYNLILIDAQFENENIEVALKNEILVIYPININIKPITKTYVFDNLEKSYAENEWEYLENSNLLAEGETLKIVVNGSTKFYTQQFFIDDFTIYDSNQKEAKLSENVSELKNKYVNYVVNITSTNLSNKFKYAGLIKITQRKITINTKSATTKMYDGIAIDYDYDYWEYDATKGDGLYTGHYLKKKDSEKQEIIDASSRRNDVGLSIYSKEGEDISKGYSITYTGTIRITQRTIMVKVYKYLNDTGKIKYLKDNDGFVKTTLMIDESHFDLVENHKLQFNAVLNSLNGNDILIRNILNSNEKNVTSNYSITIIEEEI